ncbi:radical SAM/SPASM domain-containing protein [Deinococcus multiflagellatus]|uniref:Radical SAM/SPASM domain-containing protein n=1 Tax=Deinococcus multiflagellatus TaxID=1656887 RepID=A0ABW1ZU81_9DEIO|nr:radical SAM protein [Deinococcus multiflagellatus]MBZ9715008.1 radical SAM protein [Deinococcus multiflagellatus]
MTATVLKRSRYTLQSRTESGVYLHNTFTGQGALYPARALDLLRRSQPDPSDPLTVRLRQDGHLVALDTDEFALAQRQQLSNFFRDDVLHLILFSTEQCNFRCTYCYEKFLHGQMRPEVREGVKNLVSRRAPGLKLLAVSWFGGEPLHAHGVVQELSAHFTALSAEHGFKYMAHATTNGYYLTPELAPQLIDNGLRDFQITLDGPQEVHDRTRQLQGGGGSFETIWANLQFLKASALDFSCTLRINFSPDNYAQTPEFITLLGDTFGHDPRFQLHTHPVGRWGGEQDDQLNVYDQDDGFDLAIPLYEHARTCGLSMRHANLNPFGSVCYAARGNSFAIRTSGQVVKCTVALDDERNHVGHLHADGTLQIDQARLRPWVQDNALTDATCQSCAIRPSCHGAACPLEKMDHGHQPCPDVKRNFKKFLPLMLEPLPDFSHLEVLL